jgi:hypothetical protein
VISTRTDTGDLATLAAHRGVDRDTTRIFLDLYRRDHLLAVCVMTDGEVYAHIKDLVACLPIPERHLLASELAR